MPFNIGGTAAAAALAIELSPKISHAEFRLLMLLSDHPHGGGDPVYTAPAPKLMLKGRFSYAELVDTAYILKWNRGQHVELLHDIPEALVQWTIS